MADDHSRAGDVNAAERRTRSMLAMIAMSTRDLTQVARHTGQLAAHIEGLERVVEQEQERGTKT